MIAKLFADDQINLTLKIIKVPNYWLAQKTFETENKLFGMGDIEMNIYTLEQPQFELGLECLKNIT